MTLQTQLDGLGPGLRVQIDGEVFLSGVARASEDRVRFYPAYLQADDDRTFEAPVTSVKTLGKGLDLRSPDYLFLEVYPAPDLSSLVTPEYLAEVDQHWGETS